MKQLGFRFKAFALTLLLSCATPLMRAEIMISPLEMEEICSTEVTYASLHKSVGGDIIDAIKTIQNITPENVWSSEFKSVVERVDAGYTTVPLDVVERAVVWASQALEGEHGKIENSQDVARVVDALAGYYEKLAQGNVSITRGLIDEERAPRPSNTILVDDGSHDPMQEVPLPRDLNIDRNGHFGGNLFVDGNLIVDGSISSSGGLIFNSDIILEPLVGNDICIIYKQSDGFEKARMCSSSVFDDKGLSISVDGGSTQNFRVQNNGNVTIAAPLGPVPALEVTPVINNDGIVIGDAGTAFEIDMAGSSPAINGASLAFATGGTTRLTIDASGNVIQAGGQYLASDGVIGAPAYSFSNDTTTGLYNSAGRLFVQGASITLNAENYNTEDIHLMGGQVQAAGNSSAARPVYSFDNATTTGMRNTGDVLYFDTAGVDRVSIDASGLSSFFGDVHIFGNETLTSPTTGTDIALTLDGQSNGFNNGVPFINLTRTNSVGFAVNDVLGTLVAQGSDTTSGGMQYGGYFQFRVAGASSVGHVPLSLGIATDNGTTLAERLIINGNGDTQIVGQFQASDGSIVAPGISFINNTTTGLYNSAGRLFAQGAGITLNAENYATQDIHLTGGQVQVTGNSSAARPAYSFDNATTTGMRNTGDVLYFDTAGVDRVSIDASGNVSFSGNVAIDTGLLTADRAHIGGVSDPGTNNLQVDGQILAANGSAGAPSISFSSVPTIGLYQSAGSLFAQGNNITLEASNYATQNIHLTGGQVQVAGDSSAARPAYSFDNATTTGMRNTGNILYFDTAGVDRVSIDASGNVSFSGNVAIDTGLLTADRAHIGGVSDPGTNNLQVDGQILAADGSAGAPSISFSSVPTIGLYQSAGSLFAQGNNITLEASNYATQNIHLTGGQVRVAGDSSAARPAYSFDNATTTGMRNTGNILYFDTAGVDRVSIDASGNASFSGNVAIDTGLLTADRAHIGGVSDPGTNNLQVDGQILAADGSAVAPSISFSSDSTIGLYQSAGALFAQGDGITLEASNYATNAITLMGGQVRVAGNSSAARPAYSFDNATTTGMRNTGDVLYFDTAGVDRVSIDAVGDASFSGNVAVNAGLLTADRAHIGGVSDPGTNNLQVDGQILAADGSAVAPSISFSSDNTIGLYQSAGALFVQGDGITLEASNYATNAITLMGGQVRVAGNSLATRPAYSFDNATTTGMRNTGDVLYFDTAGVDRVSIDASGNTIFNGNVELLSPAVATDISLTLDGQSNGFNNGVPSVHFTRTNTAAFALNDVIGSITVQGSDTGTAGLANGAYIQFRTTGFSSPGNLATIIGIATNDGVAFAERLIIDNQGHIFMPYLNNVASANAVTWNNATGELTSLVSSRRYKDNITDLKVDSSVIYNLKPVSFEYKKQPGVSTFGLIAEDVMEVCPELVGWTTKSKAGLDDSDELIPDSVAYHMLPTLMLNEMKKMKLIEQTQQAEIAMLTNKLDEVMARLAKLEQ